MTPSFSWRAARALMSGPGFKGRDRLLLELRPLMRRRPALVRTKTRDGLDWELDLADEADAWLYVYREFDPEIVTVITTLAKPGSTVLDVGANIGCVAVPVAASGVQVHAFEPTPRSFHRLVHNLQLNGCASAKAINAALGHTQGVGRLIPSDIHRSVENRVFLGEGEVQILTIDGYCEETELQPNLLKIDAEGAEWDILRGASTTLSSQPNLVLEVNTDSALERSVHPLDMLDWLRDEHGYEFRVIGQSGLQPMAWARDERIVANVLGLGSNGVPQFAIVEEALTLRPERPRFRIY